MLLMRFMIMMILCITHSGYSIAEELNIGLLPEQNVFKQVRKYQPLGAYIEKNTGMTIRFTLIAHYGDILEEFEKRNMDGAFWGSYTAAMAIEKMGIRFIARPVNLDGTSTYRGYIFSHRDSSIRRIDDMRNAVMAFVDQATTAGYIFPVSLLKEYGMESIDSFFSEYFFTGTHDAAIFAVLNHDADVGAAKNTIFSSLATNNPLISEKLIILAESPEVPSNGLGLRADISDDIAGLLKQVLLNMDKVPEGREVLKELGIKGYIHTEACDYQPVLEIIQKSNSVNKSP